MWFFRFLRIETYFHTYDIFSNWEFSFLTIFSPHNHFLCGSLVYLLTKIRFHIFCIKQDFHSTTLLPEETWGAPVSILCSCMSHHSKKFEWLQESCWNLLNCHDKIVFHIDCSCFQTTSWLFNEYLQVPHLEFLTLIFFRTSQYDQQQQIAIWFWGREI